MAEHGRTEYATAPGNDYVEHENTYLGVMRLTKVGTVCVLIIVVSLGIFATAGSGFWALFGIIGAIVTLITGMRQDTVVPAAVCFGLILLVWALLV